MSTTTSSTTATAEENPLSTAQLRYELRTTAIADGPGPEETRPFGLRAAQPVPTPVRPQRGYCPIEQVAVDADGRPLIETMGKEWKTKSSSDGDEGPEENYGWEEESDE